MTTRNVSIQNAEVAALMSGFLISWSGFMYKIQQRKEALFLAGRARSTTY